MKNVKNKTFCFIGFMTSLHNTQCNNSKELFDIVNKLKAISKMKMIYLSLKLIDHKYKLNKVKMEKFRML